MFLITTAICLAEAPPPLPVYDWNACPYEGCMYGPWIARKPATAYETWKPGRRVVAQISKDEVLTGLNGVVITFRPGVIHVDRDIKGTDLRRGDSILTYAFRGEGFSAVWFKRRFESDFDISFTRWPDGTGCGNEHCAATYIDLGRKEWWAQVKLRSGRTGWVSMEHADIQTRSSGL